MWCEEDKTCAGPLASGEMQKESGNRHYGEHDGPSIGPKPLLYVFILDKEEEEDDDDDDDDEEE